MEEAGRGWKGPDEVTAAERAPIALPGSSSLLLSAFARLASFAFRNLLVSDGGMAQRIIHDLRYPITLLEPSMTLWLSKATLSR